MPSANGAPTLCAGTSQSVTIGFSPDEHARLQAPRRPMPVSRYVKWLLQGSPVDGVSKIGRHSCEPG